LSCMPPCAYPTIYTHLYTYFITHLAVRSVVSVERLPVHPVLGSLSVSFSLHGQNDHFTLYTPNSTHILFTDRPILAVEVTHI
jgi:hypothetical protein